MNEQPTNTEQETAKPPTQEVSTKPIDLNNEVARDGKSMVDDLPDRIDWPENVANSIERRMNQINELQNQLRLYIQTVADVMDLPNGGSMYEANIQGKCFIKMKLPKDVQKAIKEQKSTNGEVNHENVTPDESVDPKKS